MYNKDDAIIEIEITASVLQYSVLEVISIFLKIYV